jgi:hypothetical protein
MSGTRLTARQRAKEMGGPNGMELQSLPNRSSASLLPCCSLAVAHPHRSIGRVAEVFKGPAKAAVKLSEAEIALKRSEMSRKRKHQSDKRLEDEVSSRRPPLPLLRPRQRSLSRASENRDDQPPPEETSRSSTLQALLVHGQPEQPIRWRRRRRRRRGRGCPHRRPAACADEDALHQLDQGRRVQGSGDAARGKVRACWGCREGVPGTETATEDEEVGEGGGGVVGGGRGTGCTKCTMTALLVLATLSVALLLVLASLLTTPVSLRRTSNEHPSSRVRIIFSTHQTSFRLALEN